MFGFKKKQQSPKSPYPKQQYEVSTSNDQPSGTFPMDPKSYPQPTGPYPYAPGTMIPHQSQPNGHYPYSQGTITPQLSQSVYSQPSAPVVQPSAPPLPSYGEAPPPYTPYPDSTPYPQSSPYPHQAPYQQHPYSGYPPSSYPTPSPYHSSPPYPTQPIPQTVVVPGGFDAGARFNAGAAPVVPPAPPGVAPNAAQMASSQGHTVVATQKHSNWFTGGTGGGLF